MVAGLSFNVHIYTAGCRSLSLARSMAASPTSRLAYIDWMRGLACLLMFQTHCYDSWLTPQARQTTFFKISQLLGTLPAPIFLFLAGVSFALVTERLWSKNFTPTAAARTSILRGAEIFGLGLLFRTQEFAVAWGWAPWTDLARVDILNTIGVSMMLMGVTCWIAAVASHAADAAFDRTRISRAAAIALVVALAIALLTPMLWTTWRPNWLPWPLESYINGVHNIGVSQPWLFPIFPWTAFAFVGLAAGFGLQSSALREHASRIFATAAISGVGLAALGYLLDARAPAIYPVYDFWHTSPNFFLIRCGLLLMVLAGVLAWCCWGAANLGFSPMLGLGRASLLVYWVHIEFVYGRVSILRKHSQSITMSSFGFLVIFLAMLGLAWLRVNWRKTVLPSLSVRNPFRTQSSRP
jgi:acyltransferase